MSVWRIANGGSRNPMDASWKGALAEALAAARSQLGETARDLEAIQFRLRGVEASLPPAPIELVELFEVD